jgi:hypothetical protein
MKARFFPSNSGNRKSRHREQRGTGLLRACRQKPGFLVAALLGMTESSGLIRTSCDQDNSLEWLEDQGLAHALEVNLKEGARSVRISSVHVRIMRVFGVMFHPFPICFRNR